MRFYFGYLQGYFVTLFIQASATGCTAALKAYENVLDSLPVKYTNHSAWVPSFLEE